MADLPPLAAAGVGGGGGGGGGSAQLLSGRPAVGDRAGRARPGDPEEEDAYGDLYPGGGFAGAGADSDEEGKPGDDLLPIGADQGEEGAGAGKGRRGAKGGKGKAAAAAAGPDAPPSKWAARKEEAKLQSELDKIRSLMEEKGGGGDTHAAAFQAGGDKKGNKKGAGRDGGEGAEQPMVERKRRRVLE